jgi:hypothetical protein
MTPRVFDLVSQAVLAALAAGVCALAAPAAAGEPAVGNAPTQAPAPHGPGHYEETSGLIQSPDCNGAGYRYSLSTQPIAPGHVITNFHFALKGDNICGQVRRWKSFNASCELVTDKPNRKTVVFQLFANRDQCFSSETFEASAGESHNSGNVTTGQHGAVTVSQMVLSYDVQ